MDKGIYLSIYLRKKDVGLLPALDKMATRANRARNDIIVKILRNAVYLAGELEK